MKFFTYKKIIQKMTIVLVILILFNFITPNYSKAGFVETLAEASEGIGEVLAPIINVCARFIGDGILTVGQKMFIGTDPFLDDDINIALSPGKIFSGVIYALDIDFISNKEINTSSTDDDTTNIDKVDTKDIEGEAWYKKWKKAIEKINKNTASINNRDNDHVAASVALKTLLGDDTTTSAINFMQDVYSQMGEFSKENFTKVMDEKVKELEQYKGAENQDDFLKYFNDYLYGEAFDFDDTGLMDSVKGYYNYIGDNDPALFFASKEENAPAYVLHSIIQTWYKIMRNIALVFLLSVLVYTGIRIMLSSTAADNTKYKKMLINWVVALCILFVLHYLMAFTVSITELIVDAFSGDEVTNTSNDEIMQAVRTKASMNNTTGLGYTILYLVLIFYTFYFLFYYVKRVVYIAFLTLISPLVALTYPIDKMGDSKAQAFEMWLREYIMNVIVQPIHLLIYVTMVSSAMTLASSNPIYAIVVIGAMIPAERFIKEMFGLQSQKGPKGGLLAGAATMSLMQKLAGRKPPEFGHHPGGNEKEIQKANAEKTKKPRMDGERTAELSKSWTNNIDKDTKETSKINKSTENKPLIKDMQVPNTKNNSQIPDQEQATKEENDDKKFMTNTEMDNTEFPSDKEMIGTDYQNPEEVDSNSSKLDVPYTQSYFEGNNNANEEQSNERGINTNEKQITQEQNNDDKTSDITNMRISPLDSNDNSSDENSDITRMRISPPEQEKKKSIKGAALKATAGHYIRKAINGKNLKKLGRKAVRTGLGVVGAGTGAVVGLAAGVASGDPSKAFQYATAGVFAGNKIGQNAGNTVANFAGGVVDTGIGIRDTYRAQKEEIIKYDKDAQKQQLEKESKKFANSAETKAAIKKRYPSLDKEGRVKAQKAVERYRNNGINDINTILNCYNLENGIDAEGNLIDGGPLDSDKAMLVGKMAERYDSDNISARKSVRDNLQLQFSQNYAENGMSDIEAGKAGKEQAKYVMQYVDMAQGKSKFEAGSIEKQEKVKKAYDDEKTRQEAIERAEINEEVKSRSRKSNNDKSSAKYIKDAQFKRGNTNVHIKDTIINDGTIHTNGDIVRGKDV